MAESKDKTPIAPPTLKMSDKAVATANARKTALTIESLAKRVAVLEKMAGITK